MNLCNSFFSLPRQKVFNILFIVLKEVFCQHSRAICIPAHGEVLLPIHQVWCFSSDSDSLRPGSFTQTRSQSLAIA